MVSMPFMARLTEEQIAEALHRANVPSGTPVIGIFYDHAGGCVEIRTPGKVVVVHTKDLPGVPEQEPERRVLFPRPIGEAAE